MASVHSQDTFLYCHMLVIHSLPFVTVLINMVVTKANFIPSHGVYYVIEGALYSVANYLGVRYRNHVLYPFLKWEDYTTLLVVLFLLFFGGLIF